MNNARFAVLALCAGLAGCSYLDLATSDRVSSDQARAIGDGFVQMGTLGSIADDPASASNDDLATGVEVEHFLRLVDSSFQKRPSSIGAHKAPLTGPKPAGAPSCMSKNGDVTSLNGCDVTLHDGRACRVSGTITQHDLGGGWHKFTGSVLQDGAEPCPRTTIDFDVDLEGPLDNPTAVAGGAAFDFDDVANGDSYAGTVVFDAIAVTGGCTTPSEGTMTVNVNGFVNGATRGGSIEVSFHDEPCGVIFIE